MDSPTSSIVRVLRKLNLSDEAILSCLCTELDVDRAEAEAILAHYDATPDDD
jgi:hypothetical protein